METFIRAIAIVGAICIGVMVLAIFFKIIDYFKKSTGKFDIIKTKGFIDEGRLVNVHLNTGRIYKELRFVGFIDRSTKNGAIPVQFTNTLVCENAKGLRVLIRADAVRVIEEIENAANHALKPTE